METVNLLPAGFYHSLRDVLARITRPRSGGSKARAVPLAQGLSAAGVPATVTMSLSMPGSTSLASKVLKNVMHLLAYAQSIQTIRGCCVQQSTWEDFKQA